MGQRLQASATAGNDPAMLVISPSMHSSLTQTAISIFPDVTDRADLINPGSGAPMLGFRVDLRVNDAVNGCAGYFANHGLSATSPTVQIMNFGNAGGKNYYDRYCGTSENRAQTDNAALVVMGTLEVGGAILLGHNLDAADASASTGDIVDVTNGSLFTRNADETASIELADGLTGQIIYIVNTSTSATLNIGGANIAGTPVPINANKMQAFIFVEGK
jgi:hypothetical protein